MPGADRERPPREVEELTSAIQEMASRVGAQFVLDDRKAQNFIAASEQRQQPKETADEDVGTKPGPARGAPS